MAFLESWKGRARALKRDLHAIVLASRDPRVPWYAKVLAVAIVAYALSPIDLIPDFVPVVGYLDDLILVPLGLALLIRLLPAPVLEEARQRAHETEMSGLGMGRIAAAAIVAVWIAAVFAVGGLTWRVLSER